jgi:hypothetical protein
MSEFFDEKDPWEGVSAIDIQRSINRSLSLTPSPKDILLDVVDGKVRDEAEEWVSNEGIMEIFSRFLKDEPTWAIKCHVTDSMVSGTWGLQTFTIGRQGYIYSWPDGDEFEPSILGTWKPARDEKAYRTRLLSIYKRSWQWCILPPQMGQWVDGPFDVIFEGICAALQQEPGFWGAVLGRFRTPHRRDLAFGELVKKTSESTKTCSQIVGSILELYRSANGNVSAMDPKRMTKRDSRILVAAFLHLIYCEF